MVSNGKTVPIQLNQCHQKWVRKKTNKDLCYNSIARKAPVETFLHSQRPR